MKHLGTLLLVVFFLLGSTLVLGYVNLSEKTELEDALYRHISSIAESKSTRVSQFLNERKDDLRFLSNSKFVIDSFNGLPIDFNKLNLFKEKNEYLDIVLMEMGGSILYSSKSELIGRNLSSDNYITSKLGVVFNKVQNDFGVGIFDPGHNDNDETLSIFTTTPVLVESTTIEDKLDMIGIVVLQVDNEKIDSKITSNVGLYDFADVYLVNKEGTLISTLDGDVNTVDTQLKKDCFKDYNNYYFSRSGQRVNKVNKYGIYEGYNGNKVYGTHKYILQNEWCVLVEVDYDKFGKELFDERLYGVGYFLLTLFAFLILFISLFFKIGATNK